MSGRAIWMAAGLTAGLFLSAAAPAQEIAWNEFPTPSGGAPSVIGGYANGCIAGAQALAPEGPGYQVIRLSRNRFYGHPDLVDYLERFGGRVAEAGLGVALVGDLAQPRGGPMPSGHASHQTGLDADIWLRLDLSRLPPADREGLAPVVMVDRAWYAADPKVWGDAQANLVHLAAQDPRVDRIFIHPALKRDLCQRDWPDRSWLGLVRPWYGHDEHFHVRLRCPAGSPDCVAQDAPPPGDGCGAELASWLPKSLPVPVPAPTTPKPPARKVMPAACAALALPGG